MSRDQRFFDPIELPGRKPLVTLRDAAQYIIKLPKVERDVEEWQAAMQALMLVAEQHGPTMFARIGVMRAINRHIERVFDPSRKEQHWGRQATPRVTQILAQDTELRLASFRDCRAEAS
jgi:hypothetical protein